MTRPLFAEFLGTLILVTCGIGTGIMGQDLAPAMPGLTLFANAFATGLTLYLLITLLGPISGAHMNPAVSTLFLIRGDLRPDRWIGYVGAQLAGAYAGVLLSHAMFDLPLFQVATTERVGVHLWLSEAVATFGLAFVILGGLQQAPAQIPALVGAWIAAAFWFTGSAAFANPSVTFARMFSDTFTGIAPSGALPYMAAELIAALIAAFTLPKLFPR